MIDHNASELRIECKRSGYNGTAKLCVRLGDRLVALDTIDLTKEKARNAFVERLANDLPGISVENIEKVNQCLLDEAARILQEGPADAQSSLKQGEPLQLQYPEPWPEKRPLADVLDDVAAAIERHVVLPTPAAADAVALWCAWTWVYDHGDTAPMLCVWSPTRRCGKTTMLRVVGAMCCRPLLGANATGPAVFRAVSAAAPLTLMLDELDTFADDEPLRGILNSGHQKADAFVIRCVGDDAEPRRFSTWCPKAIGLIGMPPPTWADRSIMLRLERKPLGVRVERLTRKARDRLTTLARQLYTSTNDGQLHKALAENDPELPASLNDRQCDNWRVLVAIADHAGGSWPERARAAAGALSGGEDLDSEDIGVRLLLDVLAVFGDDEALTAKAIADRLVNVPDSPWPTFRHGSWPISPEQVGRKLRQFGAEQRHTKEGRFYYREDVARVASRYCPINSQGDLTVTTVTGDHKSMHGNELRL